MSEKYKTYLALLSCMEVLNKALFPAGYCKDRERWIYIYMDRTMKLIKEYMEEIEA